MPVDNVQRLDGTATLRRRGPQQTPQQPSLPRRDAVGPLVAEVRLDGGVADGEGVVLRPGQPEKHEEVKGDAEGPHVRCRADRRRERPRLDPRQTPSNERRVDLGRPHGRREDEVAASVAGEARQVATPAEVRELGAPRAAGAPEDEDVVELDVRVEHAVPMEVRDARKDVRKERPPGVLLERGVGVLRAPPPQVAPSSLEEHRDRVVAPHISDEVDEGGVGGEAHRHGELADERKPVAWLTPPP
mmetsp:Transcript_125295/g.350869  ORF Transcript_125295/g.350869 Transcript_125295/m.350869 type:complete len:245 (+) Transcript_125295:271-1005(+)